MVRLKWRTFYTFMLVVTCILSAGQSEDEIYRRGMEAYQNEQWSLAIQEFESILRRGYQAEVLYYNLGNAYYRGGDVAGAVWAYEKALKLNPNDADARYNLVLANLRVEDRIDIPEIPFYIRLYRGMRESFTPAEWIRWVSIVLLVTGLLFALSRFLQRRWLAWPVLPGTIAAVLIFLFALDSIITTSRTREGIIYSPAVTVYSAPSERSTKLFELHEGLKVTILEQSEGWYQIELIDGKSGWMLSDQLRSL
ncbi:MAG: tetratricopeptide repeat protein [Fidelibacterota bacterium]|nr:MAG: tetratricopeptide repeat protein [Candidatus Neomarinimicrobiota bacterium]